MIATLLISLFCLGLLGGAAYCIFVTLACLYELKYGTPGDTYSMYQAYALMHMLGALFLVAASFGLFPGVGELGWWPAGVTVA